MRVEYKGLSDNPGQRLQDLLSNPPHAIAIDIETISLEERMPLGFAVAFSPDEAYYFSTYPEEEVSEEFARQIGPLVRNIQIVKAGHNWPFDMGVWPLIPRIGDMLDRYNVFDTAVAARLLGVSDDNTLEGLAYHVDKTAWSVKELFGKYRAKTMLEVPPSEVAKKCLNDAMVTLALYYKFFSQIEEKFASYFRVEMDIIPILLDMSMPGMRIDQDKRAELEEQVSRDRDFYKSIIMESGIENANSAQQVGYILAKRGNFLPFTRPKPGKKRTYKLSTREEDLEFLSDPLAAAIIAYRKADKALNTYIEPLGKEDRFYTQYSLDTIVFRIASSNRNVQNIPDGQKPPYVNVRQMILPDRECYTTGDLSQEHIYILAHMSGDRDMLRILYEPLKDGEKRDFHQKTADMTGLSRKLCKTVNYAVIYGGTIEVLMEQLKTRDKAMCGRVLDSWFGTFREAGYWIREAQRVGMREGWSLPTLHGRRIRLPMSEGQKNVERKAVNYPILGSDGEIIKRAMILCSRKGLGPPTMRITVHDSITWDGDVNPPVEEIESLPGFKIPFEVKKTLTWE